MRDRIPEIIMAKGQRCEVRVLDGPEYQESLREKLSEELQEYLQSGVISELADLVEVVYAILEHERVPLRDFERLRLAKREERGGFEQRLFLASVSE